MYWSTKTITQNLTKSNTATELKKPLVYTVYTNYSGCPGLCSAERGYVFVSRTTTTSSEGGTSSLQLQLSVTHCRFTFAPSPSVDSQYHAGLKLAFQ